MATSAVATAELDYRPSYLAASIAALAVLALYVLTLSPETAMWDTSEYLAAAYTLGLPHPPGNPFFVLLGRVFSLLPIGPNVATRINLLAALSSAVSAGMWFLITERVLVAWFPQRWQRIVGGSLAALIGATAFTVWSQSVVNEKVYTVSMVGMAIVAWLTVRWCDDPDGRPADRLLVLIAYVCGLGYANHMAGMLAAPAVGLAVLIRRPATILRWRLILAAAAALVLGATPFATQPIRAAHFPAINEGEPTACRTKLEASCTFSKGTWTAFKYNFDRGQYAKPPLSQRMAPFSAQLGMWWMYFKWQWWRDIPGTQAGLQGALAAVFLVLGLLGGWVHYRRDPRSFAFFGPLMFSLTLLLIYYLNFKYGYSQSPELGDSVDREVRDRDYFYLWSFSAWSVWAALGLVYLWETVAALVSREKVVVGRETVELPTRTGWLAGAPVLLVALFPLFGNWDASSRRGETDAADFAVDLLNSVEPYGILVTVGDNDTFPLWYAQEVLGVRRDVVVANTSLLNTDWYTRQLIRRPVFEYDAAAGPAVYRGQAWPKPSGPPLKMSMDEADAVPLGQELREASVFEAEGVRAVLQPRFLARADIFVLRMLKDSPERPMFFSRTAGGYVSELGLESQALIQGLTEKIVRGGPIKAGGDTVAVPGEGYVDLARSKALWAEYKAPASLIRKDGWPDRASIGIPFLYVRTGGLALAEAMRARGDAAGAAKTLQTVQAVAASTGLDKLLGPDAFRTAEPVPLGDTAAGTKVPAGTPPPR